MLWTKDFWKGAAERGIKTFAQTLVGYFVVGTTGILDLDWATALSVAAAATLASLLTSIGNADFTAGAPVLEVDFVAAPEGQQAQRGGGMPVAAPYQDKTDG